MGRQSHGICGHTFVKVVIFIQKMSIALLRKFRSRAIDVYVDKKLFLALCDILDELVEELLGVSWA